MHPPDWLVFFQRTFPSANMVLVYGERPVLIDTGFGSDWATTAELLLAAGMPPERIGLIVNTHYHCDHAGGNHALQSGYDIPVAASAFDAALINERHVDACMGAWLDQPVEPYAVQRPLNDGDWIDAGGVRLQVIAAPGHTRGQICLYEPHDQVLICGDAVHGDDVGWINVLREGPTAMDNAIATVERLAALPVRWACSGHGPPMASPSAAFAAALRRYERWRHDPQRVAWHACKRIFTYHLMLQHGMTMGEIDTYLRTCPWYLDFCRNVFHSDPEAFIPQLMNELLRSQAAEWQHERLVPAAPYTPPAPDWLRAPGRVCDWPPHFG